ncbi:MAG: methyltransferase domain-containing protein [Alphaproteobacteria bacterium]|nr:methyltransferase domain-containing protein [Alphaproteobacteria bacterium]
MSELERWESRFSAPGYLFGDRPNAFLARQADRLKPGMKALCVADGDGRNGVWLAEQGLEVHSVDFSPTALAKARVLATKRGVSIHTERAELPTGWEWPTNAYDLVVGIFIQFSPPDEREIMFDNMKKALKEGGLLLIEGYGPKQLEYATGGPKKLDQLYTKDLLMEHFGEFFELTIEEYDQEVDEGEGHSGMSALVDLVGRK